MATPGRPPALRRRFFISLFTPFTLGLLIEQPGENKQPVGEFLSAPWFSRSGKLFAEFFGANVCYRIYAGIGDELSSLGTGTSRIGESTVGGNIALTHRVAHV